MLLHVNIKAIRITPDFKKVIPRFFNTGNERATVIIARVLQMPVAEADWQTAQLLAEFAAKYRDIESVFIKHFELVKHLVTLQAVLDITASQKLLIGAYFTMEYAIEAAALFNPSIVSDPDQSGVLPGHKKVIISFRATGESHISSIVFRRGVLDANCDLLLDEPGRYMNEGKVVPVKPEGQASLVEELSRLRIPEDIHARILEKTEDPLAAREIEVLLKNVMRENREQDKEKIRHHLLKLMGGSYDISFTEEVALSERVIFPVSYNEKNGIEDARFVQFTEEDGSITYYATYTAYDGSFIVPKLISTKDFLHFRFSPLYGQCAVNKNLALFPRKINGKYVMLSRVDGVNNYIMESEDMYVWEQVQLLQQPAYPWEFVQIGNGGSPIETEKGWLVITHGVGPMRKYCLGASLLDISNPGIELGRLKYPLLIPGENEKHGYVPNVVYSCGAIVHGRQLFIPYAVADYACSFATVGIDDLLNILQPSQPVYS